ncbi:MAG: low-specificity L-threonine aldolase [candidate division Zixibacteria bacterium]|nr:low-specificity L-threonine aldolase [candidate division Zixibacteria bacterium]
MDYLDLRSDTVTRPSAKMRQQIAAAEVGDDVFEDDPTVKRLESMVAALFGREASLYVPSGSMANLVCLHTVSKPGDEIICEEGCHVFNFEAAAAAAISGLLFHIVRGERGAFTADKVRPLIRPESLHSPRTRIIEIENTHNRAGGTIFPLDDIRELHRLAGEYNLKTHLDGARIWNAHIATGVPLAEYAQYFDTVAVCLSKGLGAPIGSMVIGDHDFIREARRTRKMFGGGMRQVGILAAAGIYAIENNLARLAEDHENARRLAEALAQIEGIAIDLEAVQTNIVIFDVVRAGYSVEDVLAGLKEKGVLAVPFGERRIRCVTHLDISRSDIDRAIKVFQGVFETLN